VCDRGPTGGCRRGRDDARHTPGSPLWNQPAQVRRVGLARRRRQGGSASSWYISGEEGAFRAGWYFQGRMVLSGQDSALQKMNAFLVCKSAASPRLLQVSPPTSPLPPSVPGGVPLFSQAMVSAAGCPWCATLPDGLYADHLALRPCRCAPAPCTYYLPCWSACPI